MIFKKKKYPFIFTLKWRDFYILFIWKISFIWITKAEHNEQKLLFEIWRAKGARALIFGKYGMGIGLDF